MKNLRLLKEYFKVAMSSAMEYRAAFFIQSGSMVLNDTVWVFFWWIFFQKFEVVQGWAMNEMLVLYAILTTAFGIGGFFFGNRNQIALIIAEGRLDFYLNLPKSELFHVLISRSSTFAFGDIVFGVIIASLSLSWSQVPLFLILVILASIITVCFAIMYSSLGFWMGNAHESSRTLFMSLITFSSYPSPVFSGAARIIMFSLIPAGFITGIPVELLQTFSWTRLGWVTGFAVLSLFAAIGLFKLGLRRYESGNMITVRV